MISEDDFTAWLHSPVTQAMIQILEKRREALRQDWEGGTFTDYAKDTTVLVNVGNLGTCKGYAFITDFSYEQYLTEIDDGQQVRVNTPGGSRVN
jgi:hypothetical protein